MNDKHIHNPPNNKSTKNIKLLQYLKSNGYAESNKKAKKLIRDNKVLVNGHFASSCSMMICPTIHGQVIVLQDDEVDDNHESGQIMSKRRRQEEEGEEKTKPLSSTQINGLDQKKTRITSSSSPQPFCIVYNKPCGMICTTSKGISKSQHYQQEGQYQTLAEMSNPIPQGYHPIGRLDRHSHGLLLFSCDGRLTSALLSPRSCIPRIYEIVVRGDVGEIDSKTYTEIRNRVQSGVETDYGFFQGDVQVMKRNVGHLGYEHQHCNNDSGGNRNDTYGQTPEEFQRLQEQSMQSSCGYSTRVNPLGQHEILSMIRVQVKEGKKRMVRRLFAALGLFVLGELVLISFLPFYFWCFKLNDVTFSLL